MSTIRLVFSALYILAFAQIANAQGLMDGTKAETEQAVQAYLSQLWSSNGHFDQKTISRFYAPRVIYYGKSMTRAQVFADKVAYVKNWPVRTYREVPGSFAAECAEDRSICEVKIDMTWRRISTSRKVSVGRATIRFVFVAVDGGQKIARESAYIKAG